MRRVRIALTLGDPRGIGPEIVAAVLHHNHLSQDCEFIAIGPRGTGVSVTEDVGEWQASNNSLDSTKRAGTFAGLAIEKAVQMALAGSVDGIVTAPIDKFALREGGFDFPGHTEMLAHLTGAQTAMMLASDRLRVVLATAHVPLRDVFSHLTPAAIVRTAEITRRGLASYFGIESARIALCAVNPHAGDGGRFGYEDEEVLAPAARQAGLSGPHPADTVFVRAMRGEFDAVIAPYHDVGMTAIKVASFGSAVNVTLGLPFPRCSPDHGTAIDIAGKGIADPGSMINAVKMCVSIIRRRMSVPA